MPTLPSEAWSGVPGELHQIRAVAESFGVDPPRYDRVRPLYPQELIARIAAEHPTGRLLDVGCGTGIAARQFHEAGWTVLGVEPDQRMAEFARSQGTEVEVATFEQWEPAGRTFDAVTAARWHWVDPVAGAAKAADVLRPGGRLAIFGHIYEPPPEIAEPFAAAFRRLAPDSPFAGQNSRRPTEAYQTMYARIGDTLSENGQFDQPEQWRYDWQQIFTREQWLDLLPTTGGLTQLAPDITAEILDIVGTAIDALGGSFTFTSTTLVATARRRQRD